jgi:hypothetical protein
MQSEAALRLAARGGERGGSYSVVADPLSPIDLISADGNGRLSRSASPDP